MNVQAQGVAIDVPLINMTPSPLNPRRHFDAEALKGLAESIYTDGLLEPLIVRRRPDANEGYSGRYEIVAGERRWRALQSLVEAGRLSPDTVIKCQLRDVDDATLRSLALVENLQREELEPLEEGEAYAQLHELDPAQWTTARIAATVGKTQRFVQLRIALVRKLTPAARAAFDAGKVTVMQAHELASAAPAHQDELIKKLHKHQGLLNYTKDPENLRERIEDSWIPLSRAIFPVELYKGPIHEGDIPARYYEPAEDEPDAERELEQEAIKGPFATDRKAFLKLQKKAAKVVAAERGWAWVEFASGYFSAGGRYESKRSKDKSKAGCVVVISADGEVEYEEGLIKRPASETASHAGASLNMNSPAARAERAEREKQLKAWAPKVEAALRAKPGIALRLLLADHICNGNGYGLRDDLKTIGVTVPDGYDELTIWRALSKSASDAKLQEALVVAGVASFNVEDAAYDDRPDELIVDIAEALGLELPECWQPKKEDPETAAPAMAKGKGAAKAAPAEKPKVAKPAKKKTAAKAKPPAAAKAPADKKAKSKKKGA